MRRKKGVKAVAACMLAGIVTFSPIVNTMSVASNTGIHEIPSLCDVNGDGQVDLDDITEMLRYALVIIDTFSVPEASADVDGDQDVTLTDVTLALRYALGIDSRLAGPDWDYKQVTTNRYEIEHILYYETDWEGTVEKLNKLTGLTWHVKEGQTDTEYSSFQRDYEKTWADIWCIGEGHRNEVDLLSCWTVEDKENPYREDNISILYADIPERNHGSGELSFPTPISVEEWESTCPGLIGYGQDSEFIVKDFVYSRVDYYLYLWMEGKLTQEEAQQKIDTHVRAVYGMNFRLAWYANEEAWLAESFLENIACAAGYFKTYSCKGRLGEDVCYVFYLKID